jgi:hypothetical protein
MNILAHLLLGLIWTALTMHLCEFERRFPRCEGLHVRPRLAYGR